MRYAKKLLHSFQGEFSSPNSFFPNEQHSRVHFYWYSRKISKQIWSWRHLIVPVIGLMLWSIAFVFNKIIKVVVFLGCADPYLNLDAGTISPSEHGEVFVLDDGGEVREYEKSYMHNACMLAKHTCLFDRISSASCRWTWIWVTTRGFLT